MTIPEADAVSTLLRYLAPGSTVPAEELRAAAARLRCEHTHPVLPPHSIWAPSPCEKCGVSYNDAPRDVPEWLRNPLAELLEHLGDDMSDYDAEEVDYLRPDDVEVAVVVDDDERIRHDWTAALAVARVILGAAEQPGDEPAPAEQLVKAADLRPGMVVTCPTWNGGDPVRIVTARAGAHVVAIRYRDVRGHRFDVQVKVPPDFHVTPGAGFEPHTTPTDYVTPEAAQALADQDDTELYIDGRPT